MKSFNRHIITIYAKQELLDWVKQLKPELHRWDLNTINHRPSAYMIEMEDQNCHGLALENYYKQIVENELDNLYIKRECRPRKITYDLLLKWFTWQYHEEVYDLCLDELEIYEE